jgi:hypothetical protein
VINQELGDSGDDLQSVCWRKGGANSWFVFYKR